MSNLHLVTGYAGKAHVSAADHGSFVEAVIRSGQYVTNAGAKFAAELISNNQIRIYDGELIMQGRHVKLDPGAYIDVTVENGAQGYYRNDLIVARYLKNADSSIETVDFVTVKGTPAERDPSDPAYVTGDINGGDALQHDMPMYRVPLDGLNVGELVPLFTPQSALFDMLLSRDGTVPMTGDLDMAEHRVKHVADPTETGDAVNLGYVRDHVYPVGAIYMSVANASPASFLGGTWTQLKDRFLLGAGSSYAAGGTGGEASHTLTTSEIPEHAHGMKAASSSGTPGYFPVILTEGWGPSEWETKERGSSGAHNNMPPYLVVYMWKRIA